MKDILSGYTEQELSRLMNSTDLTLNELIRQRLGLTKNKDDE